MQTGQTVEYPAGNSRTLYIPVTADGGGAKDLTGVQSIKWELLSAGKVILMKTIGNGVRVGVATNGEIYVDLTPAETQGKDGNYTHACQVTDANGYTALVFQGDFILDSNPIR